MFPICLSLACVLWGFVPLSFLWEKNVFFSLSLISQSYKMFFFPHLVLRRRVVLWRNPQMSDVLKSSHNKTSCYQGNGQVLCNVNALLGWLSRTWLAWFCSFSTVLLGSWLNLHSCSTEPSVLCELSCACSDCAAVLLIFNGKWLRFLSEPLELAGRFRGEPPVGDVPRPVRVHWSTGGRPRLRFKVIRRPLLRRYSA